MAGLAKQFIDLQGHLGTAVRIPSADATAEDIDTFLGKVKEQLGTKFIPMPDLTGEQGEEFFKGLGKPDKPEDYTMPALADGVKPNDAFIEGVRKQAHALNLTDKQFQQYVKETVEASHLAGVEWSKQQENAMAALKTEWGNAFKQNVGEVALFVDKMGAPKPMVEAVQKGTAGTDLIKWLHGLARQMHGEGLEVGLQQGGARNESPAEINARIKELQRKVASLDTDSTPDKRAQQQEITKEIIKLYESLQKE